MCVHNHLYLLFIYPAACDPNGPDFPRLSSAEPCSRPSIRVGFPFLREGRGRRAPGLSVAPKERKKGAPSNLEVGCPIILPSLNNKPLSDLRRAVCSGHAPTIMGFGLSGVRSDVVNNPRLHSRGPSFGGQVGPDYSNPLRRNHPSCRGISRVQVLQHAKLCQDHSLIHIKCSGGLHFEGL